MEQPPNRPRRGRGALNNPDNRFHEHSVGAVDDGWGSLDQNLEPLVTSLGKDSSRTVISYNQSPDVPFDRSINPYRGCEHGCVYCFARPTHAYLDLSPGLDFESKLFYKPDAAQLLRKELAHARYRCAPIALGVNTDAYQPVERKLGITRAILEVLLEFRHPVSIITKSALVERDLDLLQDMARAGLVHVVLSITSLDPELARTLEPRAPSPARRLATLQRLNTAGIPTGILLAPLIPVLNDPEMEAILAAVHEAGAQDAAYVLLRLPHEVKPLFHDWLAQHRPLQAKHVIKQLQACRGGRDYDAAFGQRMRGTGVLADLLAQRFKLAYSRLGFTPLPELDTSAFQVPSSERPQLSLF